MVRYKAGDKVICIFMPRNYGNRLPLGREYVVRRAFSEDGAQWVEIEGAGNYEAKYFKPVVEDRPFLFRVTLNNGHKYNVRCTNEAMKELADIIGDDHLTEIVALPSKLKKKAS